MLNSEKISNSLNSSNLSSKLIADGATFTSTVNENNLIVNYSKEDTKVDLTIPLIDNELEINIKEENKKQKNKKQPSFFRTVFCCVKRCLLRK